MERFQYYLEIVPLPFLIGMPIAAIMALLITPGRLRLSLALILMVCWLTLGRMEGIGTIQAFAKATSVLVYLLVLISALLHPGPRRSLPGIVWIYPIMAAIAHIYVLSVVDRELALAIRIQWLILTLAAIAVARTIVDRETLEKIFRPLTLGFALALAFPLSALVIDPANAIDANRRFTPYDVNPNQIGVLFSLCAVLSTYRVVNKSGQLFRYLYIGTAVLAAGLAVLTASRSTLVTLVVPMMPLVLVLTRRPVITTAVAVSMILILNWVFQLAETSDLTRLSDAITARPEQWMTYLKIIIRRPVFGLLGVSRDASTHAAHLGFDPHNAYLAALYLGGLSFALPMFFLVFMSMMAVFTSWRSRKYMSYDPLFVSVMAALLLVMYAHGFVNSMVYHPTYTWSYLHILLSILFLAWAGDVRAWKSQSA